MIVAKSPGIVLENIKHNVISILTRLVKKNDFGPSKHKNVHESERNKSLNDFSCYFVEILYASSLKKSSL